MRPSEHSEILFEWRRIVGQAEGVNRPRIGEQFAPPESGFHTSAWNVAELMLRRLGSLGGENVRLEKIESCTHSVSRRPSNFRAPVAGNRLKLRIGGMPVLHVNRERRLLHNSCVAILQPVVPPAQGLIPPFDLRAGLGIVGKSVIPRSNDRFDRRFYLLEHVRDGVAIAVEQASN